MNAVSEGLLYYMSDEEIEDLVNFGLTVLQAKTYIALLRLGNAHASQISPLIGTVRPETYRVLRELSLKGIVERSPGTPSEFRALPPNRAIPLLLAHFRNKFKELSGRKQRLIGNLGTYSPDFEKHDERVGLTFTTADNEEERNILMIKQVRHDYVAIVSKVGLRIMGGQGVLGEETMLAVAGAKRRGVQIRMISEIDATNARYANNILKHAELRNLHNIQFYLQVFDKRELILGPAASDAEIKTPIKVTRSADLWTNNQRFVEAMYSMFETLWHQANVSSITGIYQLPG